MKLLYKRGVYRIRNIINNDCYIGSTAKSGFDKRFWQHKRDLILNKHHSIKLQRAYIKYGRESFIFEPLIICSGQDCLYFEQKCLDNIKPKYNILKIAGSHLGRKRPKSTCDKISKSLTGKKLSTKTKEKIGQTSRGRKWPLESRQRVSELYSGSNHSQYGTHKSLVTKEKMSKINIGKHLGEKNLSVILTENQVIDIRKRLDNGEKGTVLSKEFGIHVSTISAIKNHRLWKHI